MDLVKRLEEYRDRERGLQWEGTFAQYFEIATKKPQVSRLSHERIYHMIMDAGIETSRSGEPRYHFFSEEIFGIENFHSAAQRLEVRKRVLLLMGPVGGGKSTIVYLIKRGLEAYARSEEGAVYALKDCPMHEEPLHLIPLDLRPDVEKEFGLYIEGDLCPHCRYLVDTQYKGRIEEVPVKRLTFSEKYRVGVGTFTPSDPKSQDISELVGGIDLSTIGEVGVESDPRAYRFDGELNIANRGIMEFVEMLKTDEKFLYVLLTLSQEQNIKTGRFSMI
jgi:serine protein kinase